MKHIVKKTINHQTLNEEVLKEVSKLTLESNELKKLKYKDVKDKRAVLVANDGTLLYSFMYNDNGIACTIPIANPILVYFHIAQSTLSTISSEKENLFANFRKDASLQESSLKSFYDFFGMTSSFVMLLMTALEAHINQSIPDDFKYHKNESDKCTKIYDAEQIQRWLTFEEKVNKVLPQITNKDFVKTYKNRYIHIQNLKELRDNIVHTKSDKYSISYENLYKKSLNFKFEETIKAVFDFINFYNPNLIEICNCGMPN